MYSRAYLLIERDLEELNKEQPWGIEAAPVKENNMFEIRAKILGPQDTMWEGGVFRLYLRFSETYKYTAPEACFHTIPFHPNVDMITGKPWVDFLCDPDLWNDSFSLTTILQGIQSLLATPDLDNSVNVEASEMYMYAPHTYKQVVEECVAASQRVEAGLDAHPKKDKVRFAPEKRSPPKPPSAPAEPSIVGKVSFEDYHLTWKHIATSKATDDEKNLLLESIKDNPRLQEVHYGASAYELQRQRLQELEDHRTLVYGKVPAVNTSQNNTQQQNLDKVNQMRKIYLQQRSPTKSMSKENTALSRKADDEPWESEVDDLVQWTSKLDGDKL